MTDQALVARCLADDQDACTDLVHRYHRMVHAIVWRTTRDHCDADDLVQETFLRVFRGLRYFGARSKLSTWIGTIAFRVALDHKRSAIVRRRSFYSTRGETSVEPNPEQLMVQHEAMTMLRKEVDLLADRYRLPLVHVAIRELPYNTASRLLGVPLGTVKANVFYAKGMLRQHLQRRLQRPRQQARGATCSQLLPIPLRP